LFSLFNSFPYLEVEDINGMADGSYRGFLAAMFSDSRIRMLGLAVAVSFAVVYAFAIGMVFRSALPIPDWITVPRLEVITVGPIGLVPWVIIYLDRYWIVSVSLEAFLSWLVLTVLVGLDASALFYLRRNRLASGWCCSRAGGTLTTLASILPATFAVFGCCGGGLVTMMLLSAGLLPLVAGSMPYYGRLFIAASVAALILLQLWLYRMWLKGGPRLQMGGAANEVARREA
jgi:hypothetical protein